MPYFLVVSRLFCHTFIREKERNLHKMAGNVCHGTWKYWPASGPVFSSLLCYFHVNGIIGIVQKNDFEIRPDLGCTTLKTSRKVVLDNPSVCLSVRPSVLLSLFPRALTGVRVNRSR